MNRRNCRDAGMPGANLKCPIIMEFENGSLQEFGDPAPGWTSDYIYQDETAILCGVWEFGGIERRSDQPTKD